MNLLVKNNIPHTIATSSERTNLEFFVKHFDLAQWFDTDTLVFDDGTVPGKPAPDLYLRAASRLSLKPEECVVIEDARSGIQAARNAGVGKVIGIGPKEKHPVLSEWGADQVVESLAELSLDDF